MGDYNFSSIIPSIVSCFCSIFYLPVCFDPPNRLHCAPFFNYLLRILLILALAPLIVLHLLCVALTYTYSLNPVFVMTSYTMFSLNKIAGRGNHPHMERVHAIDVFTHGAPMLKPPLLPGTPWKEDEKRRENKRKEGREEEERRGLEQGEGR